MIQTVTVEKEFSGNRVDKFLSEQFPDLSRSYIQKLIKDGHVTANGKIVKANYKLNALDTLALDKPELQEPDIVNKPKGMVVHPSAGHYSGTLVNALMYHCKDQLSGINGIMRPGIVHRIDMDTTGSLLVCKNDFVHQDLAEQLKEHSIQRIYHAIVHGVIKEDEGTIDAPIGRHPIERKKMSVNYKNGKHAVTHYKVIERFKNYTYIKCQLETGRTHQIRVHMAHIRHPLLGDAVYGPAKCPFKLQGQTLHAKTLGIVHPRTHEYIEVDAPLPDYFISLLNKLKQTS